METHGKLTNVRIGWRRDEDERINGLFLRIYNQSSITAYSYTFNFNGRTNFEKIFPSSLSSKYIYLIGGIILTIGAIYFAKKYFEQSETKKA